MLGGRCDKNRDKTQTGKYPKRAIIVTMIKGYSRWGCCPGCKRSRRGVDLLSPRQISTGTRAWTGRSFRRRHWWRRAACCRRSPAAGWIPSRSSGRGSWTRSRWRPAGCGWCRTAVRRCEPARRSAAGSSPAAAARSRTRLRVDSPRCALHEKNPRKVEVNE